MFATIGRTWQLTKMSWGVLQSDRKLIVFPMMSGLALVILAALLTGVGAGFGTIDRLGSESAGLAEADIVLLGITYFLLAFVIIYFNAALVGAAMVRLAGGTPTLGDGFRLANSRLPQIAGWALISATVGLILQILRSQSRDNFVGQIALSVVGGVWAYLTFFVVPVLVAEQTGPISAIKRSSSLFKRTWGEQVVANFGFGIVGFVAALVGLLPAILVGMVSPMAGLVVGVVTVGLAIATVSTLEAIFKAALVRLRGRRPRGRGVRPQHAGCRVWTRARRPARLLGSSERKSRRAARGGLRGQQRHGPGHGPGAGRRWRGRGSAGAKRGRAGAGRQRDPGSWAQRRRHSGGRAGRGGRAGFGGSVLDALGGLDILVYCHRLEHSGSGAGAAEFLGLGTDAAHQPVGPV